WSVGFLPPPCGGEDSPPSSALLPPLQGMVRESKLFQNIPETNRGGGQGATLAFSEVARRLQRGGSDFLQHPLDPTRPGVDHRRRTEERLLPGAGVDVAANDQTRLQVLDRVAYRRAAEALAASRDVEHTLRGRVAHQHTAGRTLRQHLGRFFFREVVAP